MSILADLTETSVVWPLLDDGLYYWRVRAINATGMPGPWSVVSRFIVDSIAPDAPTLLLPTENMLYNTPRPTFKWTAVPGATAYHVYIAPPNGMCDSENSTTYWIAEYVTTTSYTMPAPMPQDTFQVCVRALDAALNFSPLSTPRTFRIFLGTQPLEGAFIPAAVKPTFRWTAAPVPTWSNITIKYMVEIDNDSDPTNGLWHTSPALSVAVITYTPPDLLPPGVYRWRVVRVGSSYDENLRVAEWRTLIVGALTTGPELIEPNASQVINSLVLLRWNEASAPVETSIDSYEVMISRSSLFAASVTTRVIETGLSSAFTPAASMNRVTHYWRVRGLWNGMPVTNWSTRSFIVDTVAPAAPVITAPISNMLVGTVRPVITWTAVPGVTEYTVGIADAATNEDLMDEVTIRTLSYTPTVNLPQTAVIVRVRASDGINDGAWASITFNVRLGTAPIQNAVVITNRPTFTWVVVPGAEGYTLQIDNDPFFDTNETGGDATIFRSISLGPVTAYTLSDAQKLSAQGTYYWRLMPSNGSYPEGTTSRAFYWSAAAALKPGGLASEEAAEPDETALPSAIFNPSVSLISLRWNGITPPPLKYEIQIGTSATFAAVGVVQRFSLEPSLLVDPMQLTEGLKYWRVRGVYSADGTSFGPWSNAGTFTIDRTPPARR